MIYLKYGPIITEVQYSLGVSSVVKDILTITTDDGVSHVCYDPDNHYFLSGHLHYVESKLSEMNVEFTTLGKSFPDFNVEDPPLNLLASATDPSFQFHDYQSTAIRKLVMMKRGLLQIATGGGKTETYIGTIRWIEEQLGRKVRSLTLVEYANLARQMVSRMHKRGIHSTAIAAAGDIDNPQADHVVAVVDTIYSGLKRQKPKILDLLSSVDVLGIDESHHLTGKPYASVGRVCTAPYRYGLSATQHENASNPYSSPNDMLMIGLTGPILVDVPSVYLRRTIDPNTSRTYLPDPTIVMIPCPREKKTYGYREHHTGRYVNTSDWRTVEKECIIENPYRMELIRRLCYWKCQEDVRILILVARHNHGILIHKALDKIKVPSVCSFGGDVIREMQGDDLTWKHDADETTLKEFNSGKYKVLIGSPKFDEGQSLGVITDLIMCGAGRGGKSQRRLFQRIGRALHSKVEPRVYDFMDSSHYMVLAQSNARLRAFERDQYKVEVRIPDECMKIIPGG